jgi:hypothetical protein
MPSQKQCPEKVKIKHSEKLPRTKIKNEPIQRRVRKKTQGADQQLKKCSRKAERLP